MKHLVFTLFVVLALAGCSDSEPDSNPNSKTTDMGNDATSDMMDDVGGGGCDYQNECADDEICHDNACVPAPECTSIVAWLPCAEALAEMDRELGIRAVCNGTHCQVACIYDSECADGETCTDFGKCVPFTGEVTGDHPGGDARAPLQAGVANVPMYFPIGVSAAGYGSRSDRSLSQYADVLYNSAGQFHTLFSRAVVLDNGEREIMLIRQPIVFPTAIQHEEVARKLQELTGKDWRDSLVISGTHTHSGPGRHWPLPEDTTLPVGMLGTDSYSQQIHDWLVESTFEVAKAALEAKQPAKFGWTIVEAFDNDDLIASDRWSTTPRFDDNRVLMMRVDDMDDEPLAVMLSFGMHSTWFETTYMTGDSAGGIERGFELALAEEFGRFTPVMFFNENGGTMSPRGGRYGHSDAHKFEAIGEQFAGRMFGDFVAIQTSSDVELEGYTHRFPIWYTDIGYEPGEWGTSGSRTVDKTFWHGGLNCVPEVDDDFSTYSEPFDYFCLPVHVVNNNRPVTFANRSMITALQLGDLTVVTMPGENSMEVGFQVVRAMFENFDIDWRKAFVWGYANDHQLYITPTHLQSDEKPFFPGIEEGPEAHPPFAFSHLQGGYEPGLSLWGYKFGDFMVAKAEEAIDGLLNGPQERYLPLQMTPRPFDPFTIETTEANRAGVATIDVAGPVTRGDVVEFAWIGGDPGAEAPQSPLVTLERDDNGTWTDVIAPSLRTYDNSEPLMMTRLRPAGDEHEWLVYWEELPNFPTGTYRFRVDGHYLDADTNERTAYQVVSNAFDVVPQSITVEDAQIQGTTFTARLTYPAVAPLQFIGTDEDQGLVQGGYRMRHPRVPSGWPTPVEDITVNDITVGTLMNGSGNYISTFDAQDIQLTTANEMINGRDIPVTRITVEIGNLPGNRTIGVDVTDAHGNTGSYR